MFSKRSVRDEIFNVPTSNKFLSIILYPFSVDEGSYEPDPTLAKIKVLSEEALKCAHSLNLLKTKEEADNEPESDPE